MGLLWEGLLESTEHDEIFERVERLCIEAVRGTVCITKYLVAHKLAQNLEHSGWKRKTGMTQHDLIIKHLRKAGSITVREALVEYSISSLTKRIQELRENGYDIVSVTKHHPVTGQRYVRYRFAEAADYGMVA